MSKQCEHALNVREAYVSTLLLSVLHLNICVYNVLYAYISDLASIEYFLQKYS